MKLFYSLLLIIAINGRSNAQSVFTNITAVQFGDSILINWTLTGGNTCYDIHLERAEETTEYEAIYTVAGICGGVDDQYYSFVDKSELVSGTTYFYILSASAGVIQSEPVEIKYINAGSVQIFIYPNPSIVDISITIDNEYKPAFLVELYSLDGKLMNQSLQYQNLFTINTGHLQGSTYLLKITTEDGIIFGDKIIVQ